MKRILADEIIATDYGQLDLVWSDDGGFDGEPDRFLANQVNGLVGAGDRHGVYVNLARRSGGSRVQFILLDAAPSDIEEQWEDVVEVSLSIPHGSQVAWTSWAGETSGALEIPPGSYRLRVSARGRDAGADGDGELAEGIVDHYLLECGSPLKNRTRSCAPAARTLVTGTTRGAAVASRLQACGSSASVGRELAQNS